MIKKLYLSFLFTLLASTSFAFESLYSIDALSPRPFQSRDECLAHIETSLQNRDLALHNRYLRLDHLSQGIKPQNQSRLAKGISSTAVFLLHGFAASPFEVEEVARYFHDQRQMTVVSPLIEGFGSNGIVSNFHSYVDWQRGISEDLQLLRLCYDQVIVGGFSLGGALLTDYLLSNPTEQSHIPAMLALSPFYDTSSAFLDFLQNVLGTFKDTYSYTFMYKMSGNRDLLVVLQYPQFYLTDFPMLTSKQVIQLGEQIRYKSEHQALTVPFFLSYSLDDSVINTNTANLIYNRTFNGPKTHSIYSKELQIPHQITRPEVNPYLQDLLNQIDLFLSNIK